MNTETKAIELIDHVPTLAVQRNEEKYSKLSDQRKTLADICLKEFKSEQPSLRRIMELTTGEETDENGKPYAKMGRSQGLKWAIDLCHKDAKAADKRSIVTRFISGNDDYFATMSSARFEKALRDGKRVEKHHVDPKTGVEDIKLVPDASAAEYRKQAAERAAKEAQEKLMANMELVRKIANGDVAGLSSDAREAIAKVFGL